MSESKTKLSAKIQAFSEELLAWRAKKSLVSLEGDKRPATSFKTEFMFHPRCFVHRANRKKNSTKLCVSAVFYQSLPLIPMANLCGFVDVDQELIS